MVVNEYLKKIFDVKNGKDYDVIAMYTGGKDSSYLIYLLKEIYKLRVLAVTIDNGYEFPNSFVRMQKYLDNVGVSLVSIKPEKSFFQKLYRELIINPKNLRNEKRNHICHVCNNIIWMSVCKYASDNEIPFIASGLSLEQLNSGRNYSLAINEMANQIAEKSTKLINKQAMDYLSENSAFVYDNEYTELYRFYSDKNKYKVKTIYPYIYHNVSVREQMQTIIEYGKWTPPVDISVSEYVSSGCQIMNRVIFELEKLELITMNEREEAKKMVESGMLDKRSAVFANRIVSNEKVDLSDEIFDELEIKEYLLDIALKRNQL